MIKNREIKKENPIIAYKGFNNDFSCRGFHYEVGKEYHIDDEVELCVNGFHACQNPLDVFNYYSMTSLTRYALVELWGGVEFAADNEKLCATDIRIVKEMTIDEMVKIGMMSSFPKNDSCNKGIDDMMVSSNLCGTTIYPNYDGARVASCGTDASIISKSNCQYIASSSFFSNIDAFGLYTSISSSGKCSKIASVGGMQNISTSGYNSRILSYGEVVSVASADMAHIFSNGDAASLYTGGHESKIASSGDNANICTNSSHGYVNSSGDNARIMSTRNLSTIESTGKNAVIMSTGQYTRARAKVGSWIVLTEYDENGEVKCVKAEYVDGERIKGDTLYALIGGEFVKTNIVYE